MPIDIRNNQLYFDGCNTLELAEQYGTPLYLMSLSHMMEQVRRLKTALSDYPDYRIAYAAKAFLTTGMARIVERLGLGLDVVSEGELRVALAAGFPAERIEFNGNNKLDHELELALEAGIGRIILDGPDEAIRLHQLAKNKQQVAVLLRLTPGVAAEAHEYIVTGKQDSKFGFSLDSKELQATIDFCLKSEHIQLLGYHFHAGSQLMQTEVYTNSLAQVLGFTQHTYARTGFIPTELNIGGGFGIRYVASDQPLPYADFFEEIIPQLREFFASRGWDLPTLVTEPGRSIVGEAGISLYRIGSMKAIEGIRTYVSVDGGMSDNIRPALYQAKYSALIANRASEEANGIYTVTGKCCESGDIIAKDIGLASPQRDDILAVFSTGAYGYAMASNYNKMPLPAVVLLHAGRHELMVARQSLEDLIRNDKIPALLEELCES